MKSIKRFKFLRIIFNKICYRLKALVAIPKVQPRYAVAVWKKYPSMKSLLKVYMDPKIPVSETCLFSYLFQILSFYRFSEGSIIGNTDS